MAAAESEAYMRALKQQIETLQSTCQDCSVHIKDLEAQLSVAKQELAAAAQSIQEGETLRRKLHNTVQELKGNIRVFCRVRPLLAPETCSDPKSSTSFDTTTNHLPPHIEVGVNGEQQEEIRLLQTAESAIGVSLSKSYPFSFDRVFNCSSKQSDVFEEISQLVQSALDGYRVCIFAYGQTGSGKTFTMEGDTFHANRAGMIPRAVQLIFNSTDSLAEKGWSFTFEASYLEIYNETIRDLLASKTDAASNAKYDIKHTESRTFVTDLTVGKPEFLFFHPPQSP